MRVKNKIISILIITAFATTMLSGCGKKTASTEGYVQVYETTGTKSKLMSRETDLTFKDIDDSSVNTKIIVNEENVKQEVEGFGGALTHSSAYVLKQMSEEDRKDVIESLYGKDGAAFSIVRIPIASSDYTTYINGELKYFTYDDVADNETDEKLEHFSIEYDKQELIPILKEILEVNPDVTIIAAPWSAPAWMKESKVLNRGSLAQEHEKDYANYLVKYLEEYNKEGINIDYMSVQNEPMVDNLEYPCMLMDEYQMARVIKELGKKIEDAGFSTRILAYDHNYDSTVCTTVDDYAEAILGDKDVAKYVEGVALHGYGTFDGAEEFAEGFKVYNEKYNTKTFLTEISEGIWSRDFASNISYSLEKMILTPFNYGSSSAVYWNLALYDDGTPAASTNNCLGVVNITKSDYSVSKSSAYYAMAHVSKFIRTDQGKANVIDCESDNPEILASSFLRADGHIVTVVTNLSDKYANSVNVEYDEKEFTYEIQPQSVVTFVW